MNSVEAAIDHVSYFLLLRAGVEPDEAELTWSILTLYPPSITDIIEAGEILLIDVVAGNTRST